MVVGAHPAYHQVLRGFFFRCDQTTLSCLKNNVCVDLVNSAGVLQRKATEKSQRAGVFILPMSELGLLYFAGSRGGTSGTCQSPTPGFRLPTQLRLSLPELRE